MTASVSDGATTRACVEISCSADAPYLPHVSAMLHSLLTHTRARPLRIWLTHGSSLPEEGRQRVIELVRGFGAEVVFIPIPRPMLRGFSLRKFHPAAWYRVLSPDLFPQLERVLYLDADIIVCDDLAPLWNIDLEGRLFGAVPNPMYPFIRDWPRKDLKLEHPLQYLNSGVLLMDLAQMRAGGLVDQLRATSTAHPNYAFPEQDALSDIARGRWLALHPRWNVQSILYEYPAHRLPFSESAVREALERPAVLHYCGWFKPWHHACTHPLRHRYFEHLRATSWPERPLENDGLDYRLIGRLPLAIQFYVLRWRWEVEKRLRRRTERMRAGVRSGNSA
jgi:lipopolysaccharide biosynthesis glycosyltransferase